MAIAPKDIMGGLGKGLAVIETFNADRPRQSIAQVAALSGLDRATARRCLLTLAYHGYADYDGKFFTLTPRVLRLGTACLAAMPLPQIVQPALDRLSQDLGYSSSASVRDEDEIVYIARAAQQRLMAINLMPGSRLPAFCTSMGRVMLAALPEPEAFALLSRAPLTARTPKTCTAPDQLMAELALVRRQGYALIEEEVEIGLCSVAVPLRDSHRRCIGALNMGLPRAALGAEHPQPFLTGLLAIQGELQSVLR